ncbi:MAG: hypothetical protein WDA27_02815 [Actinomycetota bacterium]
MLSAGHRDDVAAELRGKCFGRILTHQVCQTWGSPVCRRASALVVVAFALAACTQGRPVATPTIYAPAPAGAVQIAEGSARVEGVVADLDGQPVAGARVGLTLEESNARDTPCPEKDTAAIIGDQLDRFFGSLAFGGFPPSERRTPCAGGSAGKTDRSGRFAIRLDDHVKTTFLHIDVRTPRGAHVSMSIPNRAGPLPRIELIDKPAAVVDDGRKVGFSWRPPPWGAHWFVELATSDGEPYDVITARTFDRRVAEDYRLTASVVVQIEAPGDRQILMRLPPAPLRGSGAEPPTRGATCAVEFASGRKTLDPCPLTDGDLDTRISTEDCPACSGTVRTVTIEFRKPRRLEAVALRWCTKCSIQFVDARGKMAEYPITPNARVAKLGFTEPFVNYGGQAIPPVASIIIDHPGEATELAAWW